MKAEVIAVDSTHVDTYSRRAPDNRTGKSDPEARVGRGRRGFILGYRVHTACCAESEMPLAFTVAPCNENDKIYFKPLLERVHALGIGFTAMLRARIKKCYLTISLFFNREGYGPKWSLWIRDIRESVARAIVI